MVGTLYTAGGQLQCVLFLVELSLCFLSSLVWLTRANCAACESSIGNWTRMAVPGDIKTTPFDQLWYNAPFDEFLKVRIRLTNGGVRRIGFHLKSTVGPDRIEIDPANGCLDPSETTNLWVTVKPFSGVDTSSDRVTIEWTDANPSAPKKYNRDWFTGDAIVRRKNLAVKYNQSRTAHHHRHLSLARVSRRFLYSPSVFGDGKMPVDIDACSIGENGPIS